MDIDEARKIIVGWFSLNQPPDVPNDHELIQIATRCLHEADGDPSRACQILKDQGIEMTPDELEAFMVITVDFVRQEQALPKSQRRLSPT